MSSQLFNHKCKLTIVHCSLFKLTGLTIKRSSVFDLAWAKVCVEISVPPWPIANSAMMSTLTVHCQWEDEMVRERTGHPSSYAEATKMKSLTLHTHGCLWARLLFF